MSQLRGIEITPMSAEAPTAVATALAPPVEELLAAPARRARPNARLRWALACLGVDGATLAAAALGSMVGAREGGLAWSFDSWTLLFAALVLVLFHARGLYTLRLRIPVLDDVRRIAGATTIAATAVITLHLVVSGSAGAAAQTLRPWAFALAYVSAGRIALYWSEVRSRVAGETLRPTLVVGAGRVGRVVARRLLERPQLGLLPVGFVDAAPLLADERDELEVPVVADLDDVERAIEVYGIEHLVVTFSNERDDVLLGLVNRVEELGVAVSIVPRLYEKVPERVEVEHLGGLPLITPYATDPRGLSYAAKYAIDRVVAAVLVLLAAPVLVGAAIAVYVSMGRPIFFRQVRIGRDGKAFEILKFRSMKLPTPEELEAQARAIAEGLPGGVEGVDRRTRVGTLLRKTSIDELPQLLNVLKGDMSVVGPRPERPEFVSKFEGSVYRYCDRHRVKSGITGWAQVHGLRGKTSIDDRAEWDNWYVENFSLWLDLKILCMTAAAVLAAFRDVE